MMLQGNKTHPTIVRWVDNWLSDRSIETWINGGVASRQKVNYGIPQGSPCSPVLFALTLAVALRRDLVPGVSYTDDCGWIVSFDIQAEFHREACGLLARSATDCPHMASRWTKRRRRWYGSLRARGPLLLHLKRPRAGS